MVAMTELNDGKLKGLRTLLVTFLIFYLCWNILIFLALIVLKVAIPNLQDEPQYLAIVTGYFNLVILLLFSHYFHNEYFKIDIFKQPLHLNRFKTQLVRNVLIGFSIALTATLINTLIGMAVNSQPFLDSNFQGKFNIQLLLISILHVLNVCLFVPVLEEILFRGFFFKLVQKFWNSKLSILVNVIIMIVLHPNIYSLVTSILLGIVLCLAYSRSGSLHAPIIIHSANNFLVLIYGWILHPIIVRAFN